MPFYVSGSYLIDLEARVGADRDDANAPWCRSPLPKRLRAATRGRRPADTPSTGQRPTPTLPAQPSPEPAPGSSGSTVALVGLEGTAGTPDVDHAYHPPPPPTARAPGCSPGVRGREPRRFSDVQGALGYSDRSAQHDRDADHDHGDPGHAMDAVDHPGLRVGPVALFLAEDAAGVRGAVSVPPSRKCLDGGSITVSHGWAGNCWLSGFVAVSCPRECRRWESNPHGLAAARF
jgi:hypothetical protein